MHGNAVSRLCKGLLVLALVGVLGSLLAACTPKPTPTLPPATIVAPAPPVPTATPRPVAAAPTVPQQPTQTTAGNPGSTGSRQATTLTILHTNDTLGETHPCG